MDALRLRIKTIALCLLTASVSTEPSTLAATWQTRNFSVTADRESTAKKVGEQAEEYRRQLAIFWLGEPLPNWSKPCKLRVREGAIGAGGQTTFQFVRGEVLNWDMYVQGSLERILDSVLPHEINHTIFACHFRRPLPRWADEGAATLFEDRSEQLKQLALLNEVINNDRERISLSRLLSMKEYPDGMRPMLILYAQGYALADFLVQQKGRKAYLLFLADGDKIGWEQAIRKHFDHEGIQALERNWRGWVLAGMPKLTTPRDQMLTGVSDSQQMAATTQQGQSIPEPSRWDVGKVSPGATALASTDSVRPSNRIKTVLPTTGRSRIPANTTVRSQSPEPVHNRATKTSNTSLSDIRVGDAGRTLAANDRVVEQFDAMPAIPASSRQVSQAVGVSNEMASELKQQQWDQPRRQTIQAPTPRQPAARTLPPASTALNSGRAAVQRLPSDNHRPGGNALQPIDEQQAAFEDYLDQIFSDRPALPDRPMLPAMAGNNRARTQLQQRHDRLEPTAAAVNSDSSASETSVFGPASQFESVHLPRERNVNSGSTPVWAEFPGQKKLF